MTSKISLYAVYSKKITIYIIISPYMQNVKKNKIIKIRFNLNFVHIWYGGSGAERFLYSYCFSNRVFFSEKFLPSYTTSDMISGTVSR